MVNAPRTNGASWAKLIVDHNPFFLLSAVCMLAGCSVLNSALYTAAGNVPKLLVLLGVINAYEILVIALALVLINRRKLIRDGVILLGAAAMFMVDIVFINGTISTVDPHWGLGVNAVLLVLALAKLSVIVRGLKVPGGGRIVAMVMVQMAILLLVPTIYKRIALGSDGQLDKTVVYATWWMAGSIPVLWTMVRAGGPPLVGVHRAMRIIFVLFPFISVLLHVYSAAWVYKEFLHLCYLSPILIGLALAAPLLRRSWRDSEIVQSQFFLTALALIVSAVAPPELVYPLDDGGPIFSPLRATLVAAGGVGIYGILLWRRIVFVIAAAGCILAACLGASIDQITATLSGFTTRGKAGARRIWPQTPMQWGIVAVVAAFVLLGIGAIVGLRKPRDQEPDATPANDPPTEPPAGEERAEDADAAESTANVTRESQ